MSFAPWLRRMPRLLASPGGIGQIWPGRCALCGDWGPHTVCAHCRSDWAAPLPRCPRCALPWTSPADDPGQACPSCDQRGPEFDRAIAAVHYTRPWSRLVAQLKFSGRCELARPMADMMVAAVHRARADLRWPLPDLLLPMPVSAQRLRERGYNQSWLLARACAQDLSMSAFPHTLQRVHHTERLSAMNAEARSLALQDAFDVHARHAHRLAGAHVLLVDDVYTTGATLDAASTALRRAGVAAISALVFARTPLTD